MKYAVIDIGSNTMRTVIYELIQNDFAVIINEKEFAELLSYIEDEVLLPEGIYRLVTILKRMKTLCEETNCQEIYCFSTASLRDIRNQKEVVDTVKDETGIEIDLLSGCDESFYDYIGLKAAIERSEGLGFDLGGGSAQLFYYNDESLVKSLSEPIGTLAMYNRFVKGLFPNSKARRKIAKHVRKYLELSGDFQGFGQEVLYGMGGTARALAQVHRHLLGNDAPVMDYHISKQDLEEIDQTITGLGLNGIKLLSRILPERLVTFMPGLVVIKELMEFTGAKTLVIVEYGVREGYLIENAVNKGRGFDEFKDSNCPVCQ